MYALLPLGLALLSVVEGGGLPGAVWGLTLPVLAATLGPPMALSFPFGEATRVTLAIGLLIAPVMGLLGWPRRTTLGGQVCVAAGAVLWAAIGLLGLGTGT